MFWADKIAKTIVESGGYKPYWVDDMKTPSGRIHVGSLRGVIIHELIWRALTHSGKEATLTWVYDDHDPMDALPIYLEKEKWEKYLGQPLFTIPSPDRKAKNYASYNASEFTEVFNSLGCKPTILWGSELYKTGKMNAYIKLCLDKAAVIRTVYEETYKKKLPPDWHPFQLVCPKCGKESTTRVTGWDGEKVTFHCREDAVPWTRGCGASGAVSPLSGDGKFVGKLPWKVEWPVKWKVIGVTIEGAGKDHMSAGGSHDIAKLICERVLKHPVPYPVAYEFFLIGGKKMSSSKGLGSSAKEVSDMMPPHLLRFLFARTDYKQAIEFDPVGTLAIPDLFDEYDRCWVAYNTGSDENLARTFEMSQIDKAPKKTSKLFLPRFRDIANYTQLPNVDLAKKFEGADSDILAERIKYAKLWIQKYAPSEFQLAMHPTLPKEAGTFNAKQKEFLKAVIALVNKENDAEKLHIALYDQTKTLDIRPKDAYSAIYLAFLGKTHGPKAAWFLLQYPKEIVIKRLTEASN